MTVSLPAPLATPEDGERAPYRIAVVCLGNICRSPMAAVVLADRVEAAGLADQVEVGSAGTGGWHVGDPMDERAAVVLTAHGYDATRHRARQIQPPWLEDHDLLLAMDAANHRDVAALGPTAGLRMFRDFDPALPDTTDATDATDQVTGGADRDVADPYYGGPAGFEDVLVVVERTADALVEALLASRTGIGR